MTIHIQWECVCVVYEQRVDIHTAGAATEDTRSEDQQKLSIMY